MQDVIEDEEVQTFTCPICTFSCESFEESDEHFTEHCSEYQQEQESVFGKFSK